ncbi:MAG: hypothetical protein NT076_02635 [Candidatus Pacearchaeota archaeon]|nr:hypothetical protein [Candidatus Pacearchaeota archaeon]
MKTQNKKVAFALILAFALMIGVVSAYVNNADPSIVESGGSSVYSTNVPGSGINFPIAVSYNPGIKVFDEASWVGLGFNTNNLAITRSVVGEIDDSANGWLNADEGTNQDNYFSPFGRLIANDSKSFGTLSWSLLKIEHDDASDGIVEWNITTTDGTKYIFGKVAYTAAYNFSEKVKGSATEGNLLGDVSQNGGISILDFILVRDYLLNITNLTEAQKALADVNCIPGVDEDDKNQITQMILWNISVFPLETGCYWSLNSSLEGETYAYAWYLTEIQGFDYQDNFPAGLGTEDYGAWAKVLYKEENMSYRFPTADYFYYNWEENAAVVEYYKYKAYEFDINFVYPVNIITSLYNSTFVTADDRDDAKDKNDNSPLRLDSIELRRIGKTDILSKTLFEYASGVDELADGKLTLKSIKTIGTDSGELPATEFSYDNNPDFSEYAYDFWGYYNGETGNNNTYSDNHGTDSSSSDAWSLSSIKLPSGGYVNYSYESNEYDYEQDDNIGNTKGAGIRLASSSVSDGVDTGYGAEITTNYYYGTGVVNHALDKDNRRIIDSSIDMFSGSYVEYEDIGSETEGNGRTTAYYVTSKQAPDSGIDNSYKRGIAETSVMKNGAGENLSTSQVGYRVIPIGSFDNSRYQSGIVIVDNSTSEMYGLSYTANYEYNSNYLLNKIKYYDLIQTYEYGYESDCTNFASENRYGIVTKSKTYAGSVSDANMKYYSRINGCGKYINSSEVWLDVDSDGYDAGDKWIKAEYTSYDSYGNLLTSKDALGNEFNTRYDSIYNAYPVYGWNPEYGSSGNPSWRVGYNDYGMADNVTDENSQVTKFYYDEFWRTSNISLPGDSGNINYDYYYSSSLSSGDLNKLGVSLKTNESDYVTSEVYSDGLGRAKGSLLVAGGDYENPDAVSYNEFNSIGAISGVTSPEASEGFYDPIGGLNIGKAEYSYMQEPLMRPSFIKEPDNITSSFSYGASGDYLYATLTDQDGLTVSSYADKYGRIVKTVDQLGVESLYEYDAVGNLVKETDALGINRTYAYDNLGRLTESWNINSGAFTTSYDDNSQVVNVSDEASTVKYYYDNIGRLVKTESNSNNISYRYDDYDINNTGEFVYSLGKLTKAEDKASREYYFYDNKGLLRIVNVTIFAQGASDLLGEENYILNYSYDSAGRLISFVDMNGDELEYKYNKFGQLVAIDRNNEMLSNYSYSISNGLGKQSILSLTMEWVYDNLGRKAGAKMSYLDYDYVKNYIYEFLNTYYPDGRVKAVYNVTYLPAEENKIMTSTYTERGQPEAVSMLVEEGYGEERAFKRVDVNLTYESAGDRIKKVLSDIEHPENSYDFTYAYTPGTDTLVSDSEYNYTYTANGLREATIDAATGDLVTEFEYDNFGDLSRAEGYKVEDYKRASGVTYYYHDLRGHTMKKVETNVVICSTCQPYNQTTVYYYNGDAVIGEKSWRNS